MKGISTRRAIVFSAGLALTTSANAELLTVEYTTPEGEHISAGSDVEFARAASDVTFALSAGLDRKVRVEIRDPSGQVLHSAESTLLGPGDRITINGSDYYGAYLTVSGIREGNYTVAAQIISSSGQVLDEQAAPWTVDVTPPALGSFSWDFNYKRIVGSELVASPIEAKRLSVESVKDNLSGIADVKFTSIYAEGSNVGAVYKTAEGSYDEANQRAQIGTGGNYSVNGNHFPGGVQQMFRAIFEITDKAGNTATTEMPIRWNALAGVGPEPYAVHQPGSGSTVLGMTDYVLYTPGMNVYENPLSVIYRLPKEHFIGSDPYYGTYFFGTADAKTPDFEDSNYVYKVVAGPASETSIDYPRIGWRNDYTWRSGPYELDVVFASEDLSPPKLNSVIYRLEGVGEVPWINRANALSPESRVLGLIAEVDPRPYPQLIKPNHLFTGTCIVPAGETRCEAPVDLPYPKDQDSSGHYHTWIYSYKEGTTIRSNVISTHLRWDTQEPTISDASIDAAGLTASFSFHEENAGILWNDIRINKSGVRLSLFGDSQIDVPPSVFDLHDKDGVAQFDLSGAAEGAYTVSARVRDNYGNEAAPVSLGTLTIDRTAPAITINQSGNPAVEGEVLSIASLDEFTVSIQDTVDTAPTITGVRFAGGANGESINLGWRKDGSDYRLEYPILFPSLADGEEYTLTVSAKDATGNSAERTVSFGYKPPTVALSTGMNGEITIPANRHAFAHFGGGDAIQTDPLTLADGSTVSGKYDIFATLRADSEISLLINGMLVNPGETVTVKGGHDFSVYEGRISLPLAAGDNGVEGRASVLLSTAAPNSPVTTFDVRAWSAVANLNAPSWSLRQVVDPVKITAMPAPGVPCRISTDEAAVRASDPIRDPVCLLEWIEYPNGTYPISTEQSGTSTPGLAGQAVAMGEFPVSYKMYVFDLNGEKVEIGSGTETMTVLSAYGSTVFGPNRDLSDSYRTISQFGISLMQLEGPRCRITLSPEEAIVAGANEDPVCLAEWTDLPTGLTQSAYSMVPSLQGSIDTNGDYPISWRISRYSVTGERITTEEGTYTLTIQDPPAPTITVDANTPIGNQPDVIAAPRSGDDVATIQVTSPNAAITTVIEYLGAEIDRAAVQASWNGNQMLQRRLTTEPAPLWSESVYTVRSWYDDLPEIVATKEITVIAVPDETISLGITFSEEQDDYINNAPIGIDTQIQDLVKDRPYRALDMGEWEVRLLKKAGRRDYEPYTDWKAVTDGAAHFDVDVSDLAETSVRFRAEARLLSPVDGYDYTIESRQDATAQLLLAQSVTGEITTRKTTGQAPFNVSTKFVVDEKVMRRSIGEVRWLESADGGQTWTQIETEPGRTRMNKAFPEGTYQIKAQVFNEYSGIKTESNILEVVAYNRPRVVVEAPRNVFVGGTATIKADIVPRSSRVAGDLDPANYRFFWALNGSEEWVEGTNTYTYSQDTEGKVRLDVKVIPNDVDLNDLRAQGKGVASLSFHPVAPMKAYLSGPRNAEVGKEYAWEGRSRTPYSRMDVATTSYFTLPNGERVNGDVLTYVPTDADLADGSMLITYTALVNGFGADSTGSTTTEVSTWKYIWPEFTPDVTVNSEYAPADVVVKILSDRRMGYIEGLQYEWSLPAGMEVLSERDYMRKLKATATGNQDIVVRISDDRGNETMLNVPLSFAVAPDFEISLDYTQSNVFTRAPLDVTIRPSVTGGHPLDRVSSYSYSLNGTPIDGTLRTRSLELGEGPNQIEVTMLSRMGISTTKALNIEVNPNTPPVCEIDYRASTSSWTFMALCNDPDGDVKRYEWTIDGRASSYSGSRLYLTVPEGEYPPAITVRAVDDAGDSSEAAYWSP